ncbi:MAG: UDP-N-acetylglucosamine 1-carboxyvinyltransferase [Planctomycetota bacterium]
MERIVIRGGRPLKGTLAVNGAKNAALPIIAASLLTRGTTVLHRVPRLADVNTICSILRGLGVEVEWSGPHTLRLTPAPTGPTVPEPEPVRRMRGSVCVLGPLLATRGRAGLPLPGGCVIGPRPIDLHLKGLSALGAEFNTEAACVRGRTDGLRGTAVDLCGPRGSTVLGTANVMMAACLAEGRTVIRTAAREPEVQDLAAYLKRCGARIRGVGTGTLTIDGVDELRGCEHELIPDRIEAGTWMVAAAVTRGELRLTGVRHEHLTAVTGALERTGAELRREGDALTVRASRPPLPTKLVTRPYPGLPTDMQPQLTALLCLAAGTGRIDERVYPQRLTHVPYLRRMGARISTDGPTLKIEGGSGLTGAPVTAEDLRAGAALVLAGLAAEGTTLVAGLDQIDRGYEGLERRLRSVGAAIWREDAGAADAGERKTA